MKARFERYGLLWPDGTTDLQVEFQMIRKGGQWTHTNGKQVGLGLFDHYMNARKLLWPDRYRHRWTDLMYSEFISNSVTILMGAGSSQKTSHASEFALINYWLYPKETLVILSTTTVAKLEMAVFGEIKMLWQSARDRWGEYLAGNPVDSKHAIATDSIEEGQVRDLRRGIKGIACYVGKQFVGLGCFPSGQIVDTPIGQKRIEDISEGDYVLGALGASKVKRTNVRIAPFIVRITTSSGRVIDCTSEHPFFTDKGWVPASQLTEEHRLISIYEAMRIVREGFYRNTSKEKVLLQAVQAEGRTETSLLQSVQEGDPELQGANEVLLEEVPDEPLEKAVHAMWDTFHSIGNEGCFLFSELQREMEMEPAGNCSENENEQGFPTYGYEGERFTSRQPEGNRSKASESQAEHRRAVSMEEIRSRGRQNGAGEDSFVDVSGSDFELPGEHRVEFKERFTSAFCSGSSVGRHQARSGGGREISQHGGADCQRQVSGRVPALEWVDSIEVLKPDSDERYSASEGGYRVYNLEIEGHPSYSVSGCLVHNSYAGIKQNRMLFIADELQFCAPTFLECLPNMFQGCESLKVIGSGNPKHDPLDQLGRAAEPKTGWESLGEINKTTVWETKFLNGRCVNLVGTDSPNFDYPEDQPTKYKGLVSWKTVASVSSFWGKDSLEYSKQCKGVMRIGMIGNRVITAALCKQHKAQDVAQWAGTERTRIYACDPAWGGINADRCVAGWGEFGIDKDGIQILRVNPPAVIPILAASSILPDDQIAHYIKRDTERLGIEPGDIFYDSTGRGTTGSAFARIFGSRVPVPISFGDKPSSRPVRHDLFVIESDGTKRLKRCDEHYKKFVSELWFSVRYVIECEQLRELPDDVMTEGTMREYRTAMGDKIEVEPKDDTRERMGCSPDLFDWLAILVEGARQRGFKIQRLGVTMTEEADTNSWIYDEEEEYQETIRGALLTH